jgi:hypothetical protein
MNLTAVLLFLISFSLFAKGLPASFGGHTRNACEIAFVKVLNGKIPAQKTGLASLNYWDERFDPKMVMDDVRTLPDQESRLTFLKELQKLVHKDQTFVDNIASTASLMVERKLIALPDIKKLFLTPKFNNVTYFYSKTTKTLTGKLDVDMEKLSFIEGIVSKAKLSKNRAKEYTDIMLQSNRSIDDFDLALQNGFKLRDDVRSQEQLRHYLEFLDSAKAPRVKKGMKQIEKIYDFNYSQRFSLVDEVLPVYKKFLAQKSRISSFEKRRVSEIEEGLKMQMNKEHIKELDAIVARKAKGEKIDPEEVIALRKKINENKLPKNLKKRALSQAKGEKSIFRKLMSGCGSGGGKRLAGAKKKFMRFKFAVGLVGTPVFYYMKNKDKMEIDDYWYEKLGYEWAASIVFSYFGGKLVTGNGGFFAKYAKGFFIFRGMDGVSSLSYDTLFGKSKHIRKFMQMYRDDLAENEIEVEFNKLLESPTFEKDVRGLLAYLDKKTKERNTKFFIDKYFNTSAYNSLDSDKITQEDLETEEGKEVMMELLAERMYMESMGDSPYFTTGNKGGDRWSFYAARATFWDMKSLAFNLALFQIMCKEPFGKVGSWGAVIALYLGDQWLSGNLTYSWRRDAINQ